MRNKRCSYDDSFMRKYLNGSSIPVRVWIWNGYLVHVLNAWFPTDHAFVVYG